AIYQSMKAKDAGSIEGESRVNILSVFPYFILYFVGVAFFNTFVSLPTIVPDTAVSISKFLIVMVMVSVGLKTDIREIRRVGFKPLLVGLIASVLISLISLMLIKWMV